jgi:RND family efflux transporter MFP subunit
MIKKPVFWLVTAIALSLSATLALYADNAAKTTTSPAQTVKPALTVTLIKPITESIPLTLNAQGSIAAWQEAVIGAESDGLRLRAIKADIGDLVKKGQVLAEFADDTVNAATAEAQAMVAEAEANLIEAQLNADRARNVAAKHILSAQLIMQYLTAEKSALAKLNAAKAQLINRQLQKKHTHVLASDDGIISARNATLGAVADKGMELFRLIRQKRLEWRAEVTASEIAQLRTGLDATVQISGLPPITGKIRLLGPTVDIRSRNALVYVELPNAYKQGIKPGMFANGQFLLGASAGLTVPENAVALRDGFAYVFQAADSTNDQAKIKQIKVELRRRIGDRLEIISNLTANDKIVASGVAFLSDGDYVKVISQ